MMMMMFLLLMMFGLAHFSMLAATKQMLDYSAFAAARTALIDGNKTAAARQVMDASLRWSAQTPTVSGDCGSKPPGMRRNGLLVRLRVPFGLPIFNNIPAGGVQVISFAPCVVQPQINESGDNADSFAFGF
jgi:hypothetical protein